MRGLLFAEGAGAFMPLKSAVEGLAFRPGHFVGREEEARGFTVCGKTPQVGHCLSTGI